MAEKKKKTPVQEEPENKQPVSLKQKVEDVIKTVLDTSDEQEVLTPTGFNAIIVPVTEALRSEEGLKLSCRVKVIVPGVEAVVYQGVANNVYGRIFASKPHIIYRHALRKLLQSHPSTKRLFADNKLQR